VEKMKQFFEENHLSDSMPIKLQDVIVADNAVVEEIIVEEKVVDEAVVDEIEEVVEEEVAAIELEEEIIAKSPEEKLNDFGFLPAFELDKEEEAEEPRKAEAVQISFEDLLGGNYAETLFVKVDQSEENPTPIAFDPPKATDFQKEEVKPLAKIGLNPKSIESKTVSLNDKLSKGINIGLNDRIAFVKHLFGNSDEDYNRVLNQLITYDNFEEAQNFIEDMVKPDYNSWEGKEDYSQRFIEIIEKKFA
jgi:hypothetical protein